MPARKTLLVNDQAYHIFNRSIRHIPIFNSLYDYSLFTDAIKYYIQENPPIKFSIFRKQINKYSSKLDNNYLVKINAYCLMQNHFHFLITQVRDNGIKKFIQRLSNSYAHHFNKKYNQRGPLFEGKFKSVIITTNEQLLHLSRYIHLNPVTAFITNNPGNYRYSSFNHYIGKESLSFIDKELIMSQFSSISKYEDFVNTQKDYQRELNAIRHLTFE